MRALLKKIAIAVAVYWIVAVAVVVASSCWSWKLDARFWTTTFIELFAGAATFLAVMFSLFSTALKRRLDRPRIELIVACDDKHCDMVRNYDTSCTSLNARRLDIYVSAVNHSESDAVDTQIVCTKSFGSLDGEKFTPLATYRSASFRWLYSSDDNRFLTTLRHSVEKYAKVVEIVDQEVFLSADGKPGNGNLQQTKTMRELKYKIPLQLNDLSVVEVDSRYKAVLLSLCLASSSTVPKHYYLKVYLKNGHLETTPTVDRLDICFVTEDEARRAVAVSLD